MNTSVDQIEKEIERFLLRDIAFFIDNKKILKKGKLNLFKFKEFHFIFTLKTDNNELKTYEIPYPFSHSSGADFLQFNYTINSFALDGSNLYFKVKFLDNSNASKYYNNILVLSAM